MIITEAVMFVEEHLAKSQVIVHINTVSSFGSEQFQFSLTSVQKCVSHEAKDDGFVKGVK